MPSAAGTVRHQRTRGRYTTTAHAPWSPGTVGNPAPEPVTLENATFIIRVVPDPVGHRIDSHGTPAGGHENAGKNFVFSAAASFVGRALGDLASRWIHHLWPGLFG